MIFKVPSGLFVEEKINSAIKWFKNNTVSIKSDNNSYRIAGKFDGYLNLANWRFWTATAKVYSCQIYDLRTVMLPSASHRQI